MRIRTFLLIIFVCSISVQAQVRAARNSSPTRAVGQAALPESGSSLPIRKVILYSNGVAYVERRGIVSGNAEINLSFKQSQVDDVLKSMVVLDLGQGKIGAVSYNSSAPPSAKMSEIPFSVNAVTADGGGVAGVLGQLQGAKVTVTSGKGVFTGSILTIERKHVTTDKGPDWTNVLVMTSETGEILNFDLNDVRGVKLLEEGTRRDINEFANATASTRRRDAKTITVTSDGAGSREMIVSYTIAAPIWKTTYRVVLDHEGKPFFQGWAIVDNVSDEDWNDVQLSLVSGSPVSFIQQLQKPFYRYRPIIPTPQDLQLSPQVYEPGGTYQGTSISGVVTDANGAVVPSTTVNFRNNSSGREFTTTTDSAGNFSQSGLAEGSYTVSATASGFKTMLVQNVQPGANLRLSLEVGSVSETVNVTGGADVVSSISSQRITDLPLNARNPLALTRLQAGVSSNNYIIDGANTSASSALLSGNSGVTAAATGEEIGDLFEYRIGQLITVLRDRSALIPIIQTKMDGERVSIYNESVRQDRPFSGVLLKNTTDLTLESGSLTVLDNDAYAGEALMERLKPKEQRLISFALDLGTHVRVRETEDREPAKLVKAANSVFEVHYFRTEEKTYEISNQTDRPKVMYIEHPIRSGLTLSENSLQPAYTTQRYYRFRVELKAFEEKAVKVIERQPLMDSYRLGSLTSNELNLFISRKYINEETRAQLAKLIDLRAQADAIGAKLNSFDEEKEKIEEDQKRLRENVEALAKTPEAKTLIARYIAKANDQETRLEQMEKERPALEGQRSQIERELAAAIRNFEIK